MSEQLSLFDAIRAPRVIRPVEPYGEVVKGEVHETLILPHPRLVWHLAEVELHQHADGLWMWSVSSVGSSYKVGPKWGKFAQTRDDALSYARDELLERVAKVRNPESVLISSKQLAQIAAWARALQ